MRLSFSQVEQERKRERDADHEHSQDGSPPEASSSALGNCEDKNDERRGEHVQGEERTYSIGKKLLDKRTQIQPVLNEPRRELPVRQNNSRDT